MVTLDHITNMILCWIFLRKTNYFSPYCLYVYDSIEYRYVLLMICSNNVLVYVGCNEVNPVEISCDMLTWYISRTIWNVVGSFIPMLRIHKLALFLAAKARFQGILFVDLDIYKMLWCSQYCTTMPIWLPLGEKLTGTSNIPYFMKGRYERLILMLEEWKYLFQS